MAQSKAFFGLRRGSTKSLTFSVYNGKQVTKDRVYEIKNPRTSRQMQQRAIMTTAVKAYSAMKEICDHSREGVSYGQKTMNEFLKENLNLLRNSAPAINLSYKGLYPVTNNYVVAKGSLGEVNFNNGSDTEFLFAQSASAYTNLGNIFDIMGATKVGDMITFVTLLATSSLQEQPAVFYFVRIKRTTENETKQVTASAKFLSLFTNGVDLETNIDNLTPEDYNITITSSADGSYLSYEANDEFSYSFSIIMSRLENSVWKRSNATMKMTFSNSNNYDEALKSYPQNGEPILNGGNI